jgi:hypothetical protein
MERIPKFVVQRLAEVEISDPHPAAELLAAFAEQLLPQAERELVLHHLAGCADCRQVIALALPEDPEVNLAANYAPRGKTWLRLPVLRWGFATAGILALTLAGVFEYRQHQKRDETLLSPASQNEDVGQTKAQTNPAEFPPRDNAKNSGRIPESMAKSARSFGMKKSPDKSAILASSAQLSSPQAKNNAVGHTVPLSEVPPPDSSLQTARSQVSDQLVQKQAQSKDVVKAKAAVPAETQAGNSQTSVPQTSLILGPSPRWAVSSTGRLQKSFDAGRTWETVNIATDSAPSQPKFVYRAVTAIGPEVWAGGTGPTLYHSVDSGAHWQTVVPSAMNVYATGDIASVEFSDQKNGSVTLSSGEIWVTSDSGQSWQRRQ